MKRKSENEVDVLSQLVEESGGSNAAAKIRRMDEKDDCENQLKTDANNNNMTPCIPNCNGNVSETNHNVKNVDTNVDALQNISVSEKDSKTQDIVDKFSGIEPEEINEDTSNLAAVMHLYTNRNEDTEPSFLEFGAGDEMNYCNSDTDDDGNDVLNDMLPQHAQTRPLEISTKEFCKYASSIPRSQSASGIYGDIENKILRFQSEKHSEEGVGYLNPKERYSELDCDSGDTSPPHTNATIGGLLDVYNGRQSSSCPTFLDYNIMEDIMTQSSDEEMDSNRE